MQQKENGGTKRYEHGVAKTFKKRGEHGFDVGNALEVVKNDKNTVKAFSTACKVIEMATIC